MKRYLSHAAIVAALAMFNSVAIADQVINDEVLANGFCGSRAGACNDGESFFPSALLGSIAWKAKDNRTGIWFDDTDAGDADWIIFIDNLADVTTDVGEAFHIFNDESDSIPFIIENGAATNLLYLDSLERIGINTNTPSEDVEIASISPTIALRDTDGPRVWEINSSGTSTVFDIADVTAGTSPFRIQSMTPTNTLFLDRDAFVGINRSFPAAPLHVQYPGGVGVNQNLLLLSHPSAAPFMRYQSAFGLWDFSAGNFFVINDPADASIEFRQEKDGDLTIGGALTQNSSRAAKHQIEPVNAREVLDKVAKLPIHRWTYIDDREQARHMGPMAEDFAEVFGLGASPKGIGAIDADGVVLAAIQGLYQKLERKDAELAELEKKYEQQQSGLAELRQLVKTLAASQTIASIGPDAQQLIDD